MEDCLVRTATLEDLSGYHSCLGLVAAERRYIGFIAPPPIDDSRKWMESVLAANCPFWVVAQGAAIVGWCDIGRREREGFSHTAELGMGLCPDIRGRGLGAKLLLQALDAARRTTIEKIELQVYGSNVAARRLYEKFGFDYEGTRKRARKVDGEYDDVWLMSLFLTDNQIRHGSAGQANH